MNTGAKRREEKLDVDAAKLFLSTYGSRRTDVVHSTCSKGVRTRILCTRGLSFDAPDHDAPSSERKGCGSCLTLVIKTLRVYTCMPLCISSMMSSILRAYLSALRNARGGLSATRPGRAQPVPRGISPAASGA